MSSTHDLDQIYILKEICHFMVMLRQASKISKRS